MDNQIEDMGKQTADIFDATGYFCIHKEILKAVGIDIAFWIANFNDLFKLLKHYDKIEDDGYIFITQKSWTENTKQKRRKFERISKTLKAAGILKTKLKGNPAKLYFKFDTLRYKYFVHLIQSGHIFKDNLADFNRLFEEESKLFLDCTKRTSLVVQNEQAIYKEEIKTKNNKNKEKETKVSKKASVSTVIISDGIDDILKAYPKGGATAQAKKNISKLIKTHGSEQLLAATIRYASICKSEGREKQFITKPSNFFGQKAEFEDYLDCNYVDQFEKVELFGKEKDEKEEIIQHEEEGFFNVPEKYRAAVSRVTIYCNDDDCEEPSEDDVKLAEEWADISESKNSDSDIDLE